MANRRPSTTWIVQGVQLALLAFLGLLLLVDVANLAADDSRLRGLSFIGAVVTVGAVALRRRPGLLETGALVAGLCSVGISLLGAEVMAYPSAADVAGLLVLTPIVTRRVAVPQVFGLVALLGAAVVGEGLRTGRTSETGMQLIFALLFLAALGAGLYLRWLDVQRTRAAFDARRDERLDLARELHDLVAHYVTGIVVQAQAGQVVVDQQPGAARDALAQIERAGGEALAAMRRMVGSLRSEHDTPTPPPAGSAGLEELVTEHSALGLPVRLDLSGLDAAALPAPVAASIHRIVLESLTNVRRHAVDVTIVDVIARRAGDVVEIVVRDDGRDVVRHHLPGVGFGVIGMTERALALGGSLVAGPRTDGDGNDGSDGWQVLARLPIDGNEGAP